MVLCAVYYKAASFAGSILQNQCATGNQKPSVVAMLPHVTRSQHNLVRDLNSTVAQTCRGEMLPDSLFFQLVFCLKEPSKMGSNGVSEDKTSLLPHHRSSSLNWSWP